MFGKILRVFRILAKNVTFETYELINVFATLKDRAEDYLKKVKYYIKKGIARG